MWEIIPKVKYQNIFRQLRTHHIYDKNDRAHQSHGMIKPQI